MDDALKERVRQMIEDRIKVNGTNEDVQDMIRRNLTTLQGDFIELLLMGCEAWVAWTDEHKNQLAH